MISSSSEPLKYLLDTNICIYIIKQRPPQVFERFRQHSVGEIGISAITYSELSYGVANSQQPEKNQHALDTFVAPLEVLPYPPEASLDYGRVRAHLRRAGRPIGPLDLLIAAHALHLGVVLVTNDTGEFSRVPHLSIENWAAESLAE